MPREVPVIRTVVSAYMVGKSENEGREFVSVAKEIL